MTVDDERFEVSDGDLKLKAEESLDYEQGSTLKVTLTASDGAIREYSSAEAQVTITVIDVNESPTITADSAASVTENQTAAPIAPVQTSDPEDDEVTVTVEDDRFEVSGGELRLKADQSLDYEAASSVEVTITASDGDNSATAQILISVVNVNEVVDVPMIEGQIHQVPLFLSASEPLREGILRIINHSMHAGEVRIHPTDDAGWRFDPLTLTIAANHTAHFNSFDLEMGNSDLGLAGGTGPGQGHWRLELTSELDIEVFAYIRASDGFQAPIHGVAQNTRDFYHLETFHPGGEVNQVSRLRLINAGNARVAVSVRGTDDEGMPGSEEVRLWIGPGAARSVMAEQLESGDAGIVGMLGDGSGMWRLEVESDQPITVMSLLENSMGHVANLSTAPPKPEDGVHRVPLFLAAGDALGDQGYVRVVNRSERSGEVRVKASDDADMGREAVTFAIPADQAVHFDSDDLEQGDGQVFAEGIGSGQGDWSLELTSDLDIDVLAYIRASDGFLTPVHDVSPRTGNIHRVVTFHPGSDLEQASRLRLINASELPAPVTIKGIDDRGESPGDGIEVLVPASATREFAAAKLERGDDLDGALGDGLGNWRLVVESVEPLMVMSLMENPAGQVTNLSITRPRVDPVLGEDHFTETMRGDLDGIEVTLVDAQGFESNTHGQRITDIFLANTNHASLSQIDGWGAYQLHGHQLRGINVRAIARHGLRHGGGIFFSASDGSPLYRPGSDGWFISNGRPFEKGVRALARWLREVNVLIVTSAENASCERTFVGWTCRPVYCDDLPSDLSSGWIPICGVFDDYVAHSGKALDKVIFVGAIDGGGYASAAIRAEGVFAPHTIFVRSQDGSTSQATPVLAAYATNLAFSNPKWGAARIKRELMDLAREETLDYRTGGINSLGQTEFERRTVKVIRPQFAPAVESRPRPD